MLRDGPWAAAEAGPYDCNDQSTVTSKRLIVSQHDPLGAPSSLSRRRRMIRDEMGSRVVKQETGGGGGGGGEGGGRERSERDGTHTHNVKKERDKTEERKREDGEQRDHGTVGRRPVSSMHSYQRDSTLVPPLPCAKVATADDGDDSDGDVCVCVRACVHACMCACVRVPTWLLMPGLYVRSLAPR